VARLAGAPLTGAEVHWITRGRRWVYSGMLSGWVAGEYAAEACVLDLGPLARAAGVVLHPTGAAAVDAGRRTVTVEGGATLEADVLSLGLGSGLRGADLPGVGQHALDVKSLPTRFERLPVVSGPAAVVGAGLGGIELALCLRAAADEVTLVSDAAAVPPDGRPATVRAVERALSGRGVRRENGRVVALTPDAILLDDGRRVVARTVLWATGPAPHPLLAVSGLVLGPSGGVRVDAHLQSTSHPGIFAAGDCADLPLPAPKSGVYSVREAPVLAHNLVAALKREPLQAYRPQRNALALVNCGDGTALLAWSGLAARGRWCRAWKHRLDAGFMDRLHRAAQRTVP
jgi:selenide,water dikinase